MKIACLISLLVITSCIEPSKNSNRSSNSGNGDRAGQTDRRFAFGDLNKVLKSQISRSRGQSQKTYEQMREMIKEGNLQETEYRLIPIPNLDNTGEVIPANRPLENCGEEEKFSSVKARINNCIQNNPERNTWDGEKFGIAGESSWSLVAANDNPEYFIWMDQMTGLVWSHSFTTVNWWNASGSGEADGQRVCENIDVFPKGQVQWRLPTRNEFLQADINGAAAVNFDLDDEAIFWTATSDNNLNNAWAINLKRGILMSLDKKTLVGVKCVGEVIK